MTLMMCYFLLFIETQTCADDIKENLDLEQKINKTLEEEAAEEEEDEMEDVIENAKPNENTENEDPSWTPEEADAAYKKREWWRWHRGKSQT